MAEVTGFHAHVYFDESTYDQAVALCDRAGELFTLSVGRKHQKAVGPHPSWSCQLAFEPPLFNQIISWLEENRHGLTVFVHEDTGNDLRDHTENLTWLGEAQQLRLEMFR